LFLILVQFFFQKQFINKKTSRYDIKEGIRLAKKMSLMDFSNIMEMEKIIRRYFNAASGTEVSLVDRTFTIRASNRDSLVNTTLKDSRLIQIFFAEKKDFQPYYVQGLTSYFPISRSGAVNLILVLKTEPLISEKDSGRYLHMALILVLFLILGCLALLIHLFRRKAVIKNMSGTVEAVLNGRFDKRLTDTGSSEFTYLTDNFNMVIARLEKQVKEYEKMNEELRKLNREKDEYTKEIKSFNKRLKEEIKKATLDLETANKELDGKYKQLFKLEVFNQSLLASVPSGIIATGKNREISFINAIACRMFDITESRAQGKKFDQVLNFSEPLIRVLNDPDSINESGEEIVVINSLEKRMILSVRARRLRDLEDLNIFAENINIDYSEVNSIVPGMVAIISDITETSRLREEASRNRSLASLGQLAAGVAHEIRNPLSAINGFAELLKRSLSDDHKCLRYASRVLEEVKNLDSLVTDVLDFARPQIPNFIRCSPKNIVSEALEIVCADKKFETITIRKDLKELPESIYLDKNQIRQVLINIIRNACQACEKNGEIDITSFTDSAGQFTISISDNGRGISEYEIENLFNPFFTTKEEGTGLGLSICYKIMQAHGGTINVESKEPGGSTFNLVLPVNRNEPEQKYSIT
jgi:signal transduction histidine kinase